jgi:hypothetical protein
MIPSKVLKEILSDPIYKTCVKKGHDCNGRITFEHAWQYSGKSIQEKWAIMPLCWYHHLGNGLDKHFNYWWTLSRANIEDLCRRMLRKNIWKNQVSLKSVQSAKQKQL